MVCLYVYVCVCSNIIIRSVYQNKNLLWLIKKGVLAFVFVFINYSTYWCVHFPYILVTFNLHEVKYYGTAVCNSRYKMSEKKKGSKVTSKIIVIRVIFVCFCFPFLFCVQTLALLNLYSLYARHKSLMTIFCVDTWFEIYFVGC